MPKAAKPTTTLPLPPGKDHSAQQIATSAVCDIMDIAGILDSMAGNNVSGAGEIEGTHIDLLSRVLREKADAAYEVLTRSVNWAPEARS